MKATLKTLAVLLACASLGSCITISSPVAATSNPVGAKCVESNSYIICGLFSTNGDTNGIDKAAKEGMMTIKGELKTEYVQKMIDLIQKANDYFEQ